MNYYRAIGMLLAVLLLPLLYGCRTPESQARESADRFLAAIQRGDKAVVDQLLTRKARMTMTGNNSLTASPSSETSRYTLGTPTVEGDLAVVPATMTDEDGSAEAAILLRREEKEWRVYGMRVPMMPGAPAVTMNFEEPMEIFGSAFRAFGQAMGSFAREMEKGAKEFEKGFEQGYGKSIDGDFAEGKSGFSEGSVRQERQ
ncbi:MAG: hypothetical protein OHK0029_24850 [Armatimonadaceae bacterium]